MKAILTLFTVIVVACLGTLRAEEQPAIKNATQLKADKLGDTKNVTSYGLSMLCGQPTPEEFAEAKRRGIQRVITLREKGEIDWDQAGELMKLGLEFHELGFRSPESLTDELLDDARKLLAEKDKKPVMLHCGSANRVGAVWAAHRAIDGGLTVEEAMAEAKKVGLRNADYEKRVIEYIKKHKIESATAPASN